MIRSFWYTTIVLAVGVMAGCAKRPSGVRQANGEEQMLALLMPSEVQIVEPFTRVASFDDDPRPDGIELMLQAVNSFDNPGLMIAGEVRVELFEYVRASAEPRGSRLEHWEIDLTTARQQRRYWNGLTQMYEFRLEINPVVIPPADQYVLAVTYVSPLGDRLTDETLLFFGLPEGPRRASDRFTP